VAPITAVLGAGLPVLFGLAVGERPGPAALTGIVTGLVAVVVITRAPDPPASEPAAGPPDTGAVRAAARARPWGGAVSNTSWTRSVPVNIVLRLSVANRGDCLDNSCFW
jgi:hypothetical protein